MCNNHTTSVTCYYTYFKLYAVHFSLLLLTENAISQSGVPSKEKLKTLFNTFQQAEKCLYIWFVRLSVCACSNSRKYSSNVLKFQYVIHIGHSMNHIENGIHGTHGSSTETHKSFLIHYGIWRGGILKTHYNMFLLH